MPQDSRLQQVHLKDVVGGEGADALHAHQTQFGQMLKQESHLNNKRFAIMQTRLALMRALP